MPGLGPSNVNPISWIQYPFLYERSSWISIRYAHISVHPIIFVHTLASAVRSETQSGLISYSSDICLQGWTVTDVHFEVSVKGRAISLQALRFQGRWGFQISRQSAHESGKIVGPTHRPPLPQELFLVHISVKGWVDPSVIVRPEGLCLWKIQKTPSGIEHETSRLVPQPTALRRAPRNIGAT